jgi:DNA-directed RNA polymerase subunit RPC12/RpoP
MVKYTCGNCRYRFNSEQDYKNKPCPYCGEKHVTEQRSAQELLDFELD